mmetsp:Transcript_26548/g.87038  ORF Transcript_26548/g.87038 Transcript_26548/m.87038 type:complete len:434 (+) Transcript_26548:78-1379(+)
MGRGEGGGGAALPSPMLAHMQPRPSTEHRARSPKRGQREASKSRPKTSIARYASGRGGGTCAFGSSINRFESPVVGVTTDGYIAVNKHTHASVMETPAPSHYASARHAAGVLINKVGNDFELYKNGQGSQSFRCVSRDVGSYSSRDALSPDVFYDSAVSLDSTRRFGSLLADSSRPNSMFKSGVRRFNHKNKDKVSLIATGSSLLDTTTGRTMVYTSEFLDQADMAPLDAPSESPSSASPPASPSRSVGGFGGDTSRSQATVSPRTRRDKKWGKRVGEGLGLGGPSLQREERFREKNIHIPNTCFLTPPSEELGVTCAPGHIYRPDCHVKPSIQTEVAQNKPALASTFRSASARFAQPRTHPNFYDTDCGAKPMLYTSVQKSRGMTSSFRSTSPRFKSRNRRLHDMVTAFSKPITTVQSFKPYDPVRQQLASR